MTTDAYQLQLNDKEHYFNSLFADCNLPALEIFSSAAKHYRMRAEFRIWHDDDSCCYAMFLAGDKAGKVKVHKLENFDVAHHHINDLMPKLLEQIRQLPILRNRLFQAEFLTTLAGQTLVTLIYHKVLDDEWSLAANQLANQLGIYLIGRSRGQKIVVNQDYVLEKLTVHDEVFQYKQMEGSFTQPNAEICQHMLEWACNVAKEIPHGDLLELYCGNGNFTLPLSRHFKRVLATEVSKTSVQAARWNIATMGAKNIALARLSAEEFTQAYQGARLFKRLTDEKIDLNNYAFSTVFVDPPRAGIDEQTLRLLQNFDNIIYVSCNPVTLHSNLHTLMQTHMPKRVALFDQFPFTPHIESGVWLQRQ